MGTSYLGGPLLGKRPTSTYRFRVDKVDQKLKGWKQNFLYHAGQEVLIKASLASILSYNMNIVIIPSSIFEDMERKMWDFYLGLEH